MKTRNLFYQVLAVLVLLLTGAYLGFGMAFLLTLAALSVAAYIQNMSFTWVSRSRNSGDPNYHRYAAWCSNGIWMLTQAFVAANVYTPITNMVNNSAVDVTGVIKIVLTLLVYAISTTEGSVMMMKMLLGQTKFAPKFLVEKKNRKVGAR